MLEIILVIALFSGLMNLIDKPYKKKIINSNTLEEALTQRKRLNRIRWGFSILFIALYIGISLSVYTKSYGYSFDKNVTKVIVFTLYVLFYQNGFNKLKGNVSFSCKEDYMKKHQSYSLF